MVLLLPVLPLALFFDGRTMYRPISDYAIIGDNHTAVLVSSEGSIDWACLPHFDSAAIFLRLLDDAQGGYCTIQPDKREDHSWIRIKKP